MNLKRLLLGGALLLSVAVAAAFFYWHEHSTPLGEARWIDFPDGLSSAEQLRFLNGNFRTVKRLRELPKPVQEALVEEGGTRLTMANPGQSFEATDAISDASLPSKRLIFAGVADNRVFLHYEQGGIAHQFILTLLRLGEGGKIEPVWRGYCGPAQDMNALRAEIAKGNCSHAVPREMR